MESYDKETGAYNYVYTCTLSGADTTATRLPPAASRVRVAAKQRGRPKTSKASAKQLSISELSSSTTRKSTRCPVRFAN